MVDKQAAADFHQWQGEHLGELDDLVSQQAADVVVSACPRLPWSTFGLEVRKYMDGGSRLKELHMDFAQSPGAGVTSVLVYVEHMEPAFFEIVLLATDTSAQRQGLSRGLMQNASWNGVSS